MQKKANTSTRPSTKSEETHQPKRDAQADETVSNSDGLLDEIDGVLEHNAQEFVDNYKQKGGQ